VATSSRRGLQQEEIDMSVLKSLTLAVAVVVGFATLANAATYHSYRYNQNAANTAAAERFQNEFRTSVVGSFRVSPFRSA
jgi:hypothetical protein